MKHVTYFSAFLTDNLCDNALDLANRQLIVVEWWPIGTYCQWMISAQDGYVTIEFEHFNVRNTIAIKSIYYLLCKYIYFRLRIGCIEF